MTLFSFENFLAEFQKLIDHDRPFVVVTIVKQSGSTPQEIGARALVGTDGLLFGTLGGGALEKNAIETAQGLLTAKSTQPIFVEKHLQKDLGMSCGGLVSLFFEPHHPERRWQIAVFGAGHVAQELVRCLLRLDCTVTCIDPRPDWLDKLPVDSKLKKVCAPTMSSAVKDLPSNCFVAIMTMGHKTDQPIVEEILRTREFPYVGVIGSQAKANALKSLLREASFSEEKIKTITCPIGEPFGNSSPAEIAISITAQLLKTRDKYLTKEAHP